jgi:hypothetical protein
MIQGPEDTFLRNTKEASFGEGRRIGGRQEHKQVF